MSDRLAKELDTQFKEFRNNYSGNTIAFPSIDDFQRKMIGKGYLLYQTEDYLSSIIYFSIGLWSYALQTKNKDNNSIISLQKIIVSAREKLLSSLTSNQKGEGDGLSISPVNEKDMIDRLTGKLWSFNTMSGAFKEKKIIRNKFVFPNLYNHLFLSDSNNVLLYGPPGTGKTLIAKASVGELNLISKGTIKFLFYDLTADKLRSKWEGGTEKNISAMFEIASKQAQTEEDKLNRNSSNKIKVKSVLFLDEVEAIAKSREKDGGSERSVTTLLQQMDGLKSALNVIVLASTNFPWELDSAFIRRFSSKIFMDLPDFVARLELLFTTMVSKYEKHGDIRRLLSFTLLSTNDSNSDLSKQFEEYDYDENNNEIIAMYNNVNDPFKSKIYNILRKKNKTVTSYTVYAMMFIKSIVTSKGIDVDWDKWIIVQTDKFYKFIKFLFYIADLTGPLTKVYDKMIYKGKYKKRTSDIAITKYGYSASDITKIINEFFSITAEEIITSEFEQVDDEKCNDEYLKENGNCYVKLIDSNIISPSHISGMFANLKDAKNIDKKFVDSEYKDIYTVFISELFYKALDSYQSTTGNANTYCNYLEYEVTGSEPYSKNMCENINRDGTLKK
jgi:SpoVK/Ycf46/Vps4 family AAA+-type ATPase